MMYPIAYMLGILLLQPLISCTNRIGLLFLAAMALNNVCSFILCLLNDDPSQIPLYFVFVFGAAFFFSGFSAYTSTTDLKKTTPGDR